MHSQCQSCKTTFVIAPDDAAFYEKMGVPAPTFCPACRFQRRLSFCNERHLYKNTCGLCGKGMIAMYPAGTLFPVYCLPCYRGDGWDPLSYGQPYDFTVPFFAQFRELKNRVPRAALVQQGEPTGSEYCNRASYNKNSYLLVRANYNEDCRYSYVMGECRDSADCLNVHKSELAYECVDCMGCYDVRYCQEARQCRSSSFLFDCRNCTDCTGCVGLRNAQYHILNQPYTKEEYAAKLAELRLHTESGRREFAARFQKLLAFSVREAAIMTNCIDSTGNWLADCKQAEDAWQSMQIENGKHLLFVVDAKDCMDYSYWGRSCELIYETANCGYGCSRIRFVNESWDSCHDLTYCDNCYASSNLFGCVGMRKKEYCILNRQYTKEAFEELAPKIAAHMNTMPYLDSRGLSYRFGEFFPTELSASAYNTTVAYEHFPMKREEAVTAGYAWQEPQDKTYTATTSWRDLPEAIADVPDSILNETIECAAWDERGAEHNCTKVFRIIPGELAFYRRMNIPLPRLCPNSRHFARFTKRNPLKLFTRTCACAGATSRDGSHGNVTSHPHGTSPCQNEFQTSYALERPEIVYCEQCYQSETA